MSKVHDLENCPVAVTVNLIGNKWKLLILRNLFKKSYRFNELKKIIKRSKCKSFNSKFERNGIQWNYR